MQASRAPWSTCPSCWNIFTVAKPVGSQTNASTPQDRRSRARHCRRWFRLTRGESPVVLLAAAAGVSSARLAGRGRLPNPGTRRRSPCLAAKMPCSRRRCCLRKNVSSQVMHSSSASTLARRSARPRLPGPASTPRWATQPDYVSDCEVATREPAQEDAAAIATDGVEDWSRKACLEVPRDRGAHVCCRVTVSASAPASASCLRGSFFLSKV